MYTSLHHHHCSGSPKGGPFCTCLWNLFQWFLWSHSVCLPLGKHLTGVSWHCNLLTWKKRERFLPLTAQRPFPFSEHSCIPEGRAALFAPTKGLADNHSAHWQSTTGLEPFDAPHTQQLGKPPSSKASEETLERDTWKSVDPLCCLPNKYIL